MKAKLPDKFECQCNLGLIAYALSKPMQNKCKGLYQFLENSFLTQDAYAACTEFSQKGRRANCPSLLAESSASSTDRPLAVQVIQLDAFCPAPHATAREERLLRLFLVNVLACYINEMTPITNTQYLFSASVMVWLEGVYNIQVYPPDHLQPGVAVIVALLIVIQGHFFFFFWT